MCMGIGDGVFGLVQAVILLAVSFFVLLFAIKSDFKALKAFGYVIAALLWICAVLVLNKGLANRYCMMERMNMLSGKQRGLMMGGAMEHRAIKPVMPK
ncbi:MAG: hypothetical protein V1869_06130 [Candidatus Omnitrophota bacterium]